MMLEGEGSAAMTATTTKMTNRIMLERWMDLWIDALQSVPNVRARRGRPSANAVPFVHALKSCYMQVICYASTF